MPKKTGLGKGLDALFGGAPIEMQNNNNNNDTEELENNENLKTLKIT